MRYVTVVARPIDGALHPLDRALGDEPAVSREAIHRAELLDDDTIVMFAEATGDADRLREILADSDHVLDFTVTADDEGRLYSYSHYDPNDTLRDLLLRRREQELVVRMPVEYTDDGAMRATYVGRDEAFRAAMADQPEAVEIEIESTGDYHPKAEDLFARLTARQQEVLKAAVRLGYYENPREATHEDVAEAVGLSSGTVGEHLRKVESAVLKRLVL
ncbi:MULTISPECIES: helix-turn-helix domain-containing protein [Halorussus]|uniref:helix-turn-helix domain-containing protein n=1 Tax=Halorussus TaxID=1070314 RepID=UPI000E216D65|nr:MULTISPECIES: helix-turn-helix domain-containing protein [Halorussus]NHN61380.1 DNA-binding protein [Halorussus sp. JP-T4]